jgi:hypothetical protein
MKMTKADTTTAASFDADLLKADADAAVAAVTKAGERGNALVEAWVGAKNAAAVAAVAASDSAPGGARKAAKRGLQVLKARGVAIPERTHVAKIAGDAIDGHEAWFVAPDGGGTSVVIVAARFRSGKHRIVQLVLRDGVGLLELRPAEMSRAQLKNSFDESVKRMGYGPVSVPLDWARARIALAKLDNAKSGAVLPLGLDSQADLLGPAPDKTPPHPVEAASLALPSPESAAQASANLHGEPEFAAWLPHGQAIQELLVDIGQKIGAIGPEPAQEKVDDIIAAAIDAATDRFFEPELRTVVANRMKDAAISILARAGKERAADTLAVAQATVAAGLITSPPHEIPFLRGFFQKALAILAQRSGGQLSIPIPVAPGGEAPAPPVAQPGEKTSPGGIILP